MQSIKTNQFNCPVTNSPMEAEMYEMDIKIGINHGKIIMRIQRYINGVPAPDKSIIPIEFSLKDNNKPVFVDSMFNQQSIAEIKTFMQNFILNN